MILSSALRADKLIHVAGPDWILQSSFKTGSGIIRENWSSLIGIITAIIGNVLISIALNTQRYAHLRINKEHKERRRRVKAEGDRYVPVRSNGIQRGKATEASEGDSAGRGGDRPHQSSPDGLKNLPRETDPLLPRISSQHELDMLPKKSYEGSGQEQKSYLKSSLWWLGLVLMIVGEAGNFLAYGFAPASIVSPLGVVALISNCIIAPFMLKERFRKRDFFGVLIAIAGAVTVVVSAKQSNPKLGPKEIWRLIGRWEFETYLGVTAVAIIALMVASEKYGDRSIFIDIGLVGLFGGYTALSTKGVASMLSYTLFRALTFPMTYLLVVVLVFTAVMQIRYLNRALQRFDSTQVIPTQFVLFTLSVILGSAILYRDFERTQAENAGEFIGGCILTFAGVWLITSGRRPSTGNDDDTDESDDDADAEADATDLTEAESELQNGKPSMSSLQLGGHRPVPIGESVSSRREPDNAASTPSTPRGDYFGSQMEAPATPGSGTDHTSTGPSSLVENPWLPSQPGSPTQGVRGNPVVHGLRPKPPLLPSRSEPMLPMGSSSGTQWPPRIQTSSMLPSAAAHSHGQSSSSAAQSHATPATPRTNPSNPLRNSLTEFVPGPLSTPLSSSLSAVVADTLRRGVDAGSTKRRRSIARARLPDRPSLHPHSPDASRPRGASEADLEAAAATLPALSRDVDDADNPLPPSAEGAGQESPSKSAKRRRALGQSLGRMFSMGRKKNSGNSDDPAQPV